MRETTVRREVAGFLSLHARCKKKLKILRPPGYAAGETAVYDLMPAEAKLTLAIPAAAAAAARFAYGKAKWASEESERVTKNHGMKSERNPRGARSPIYFAWKLLA